MEKEELIQSASEQLLEAARTRITCNPVRDIIGDKDLELAYAVQNAVNKVRISEGAKRIGSKIGLTSVAVQKQLGVNQPDYGTLFNTMQIANGGILSVKELMQAKAETEVAFVLGNGLDSTETSMSQLIDAIDYATASIEIVGSRVSNWNIRITDTIADNASASHFVIGNEKASLSALDLVHCSMEMKVNNEVVSTGKGEACLGSPLNAALWLTRTMAQLNQPLQKGDIILSGALGPMAPITVGDEVVASIEGLGSVSFSVGE